MLPHNIICKIGSFLPLSSILNLFLVRFNSKIDCDLFWLLQLKVNGIKTKKHLKPKKIAKSVLENGCCEPYHKHAFEASDEFSFIKWYGGRRYIKLFISYYLSFERITFNFDKIREIHYLKIPNLKVLEIGCEKISNIDAPKLERIQTISNNLTSIKKINAPKLKELFLYGNKLISFNCKLPSLAMLDIRKNFITELDLNLFNSSDKFSTLICDGFKIIENKHIIIMCDLFLKIK